MSPLDLAARNIRRNARRSLLTLAALAVGTMAVLLFAGYVTDTIQGLQTATVRSTGHFQIMTKGYLEFGRGNPGRFAIRNYPAIIAEIRRDPELASMLTMATPVLDVEGVSSNYETEASTSFVGEGVVPADYAVQSAWDGFGIGSSPKASALSDAAPDTGVIGHGLAQILGLCEQMKVTDCRSLSMSGKASPASDAAVDLPSDLAALSDAQRGQGPSKPGAVVDLLASSATGNPNAVRMTVGQVQRQLVREIDSMFVAVPLSLAQRLVFGPGQIGASAIVVQLRHTDDMSAAKVRLDAILAKSGQPLELISFHAISSVYDQIVANYSTIFQFIATLIVIITLFSIANAINMAVSERTTEIGTLRALGFHRKTIRSIFVWEGALLGLAGTAVGAVLAIMIAEGVINISGLSWTPPGRSTPIPIEVDLFSNPGVILLTVAGLSIMAAISAVVPASRAAKLEITEALRHV